MKTVVRYRDTTGNVRYKLDGKIISAKDAKEYMKSSDVEFIDRVDEKKDDSVEVKHIDSVEVKHIDCADRLTAINLIESETNAPFIIDSSIKGYDTIFAKNIFGDELEMHDEYIRITRYTHSFNRQVKERIFYWLDIPESCFIAELKKFTDDSIESGVIADTFRVTGNSGKIYTYNATTLEVISEEFPEVETSDEKGALVELLHSKQKQLKRLIGNNDVKSIAMAHRLQAQIKLIVAKLNNINSYAKVA